MTNEREQPKQTTVQVKYVYCGFIEPIAYDWDEDDYQAAVAAEEFSKGISDD